MTIMIEPIVDKLFHRRPLQSLAPRAVWDPELDSAIASLDEERLGKGTRTGRLFALSVKSGLHLWNDSLEKSHTLSQNIPDATGSYWHGIMHRMEQDYSNSKYWFRQAGSHPLFGELQSRAAKLAAAAADSALPGEWMRLFAEIAGQSAWNPFLFIDVVQKQTSTETSTEAQSLLERIQWLEMGLLLRYSYRECNGGSILEQL
jgi:hypothetical protein